MKGNRVIGIAVLLLCGVGAWVGYERGLSSVGSLVPEEAGRQPDESIASASGPRSGTAPRRMNGAEVAEHLVLAAEHLVLAAEHRDREALAAARGELAKLSKDELLRILPELGARPDHLVRAELLRIVLNSLVQLDPVLGLEEAARWLTGRDLRVARSTALGKWAERSPLEALGEARRLAEAHPREADDYYSATFEGWARSDFDRAAAAWGELDGDTARDGARRALARVAGTDPGLRNRLMNLAQRFESDYQREKFVREGVQVRGQRENLEEVEAWIDAQEIEPGMRATLLRALAEARSVQDPERTANWLLSRSTPESRGQDLEAVVSSWAMSQPQACGAWLENWMVGPEADPAVAEYSAILARRNPSEALGWAARIQSGEVRLENYRNIVRQMGPIPAARVRTDLQNAGLPDDLVALLLEERALRPD